jgi:prepilin-type N-terminal cleavage/methylation domain-containing protein
MNNQKNQRQPEAGFTLFELLTVVVILGVLVTLFAQALPFIEGKVRDKARIHNMDNLRRIIEIYRSDTGHYPTTAPTGTEVSYAMDGIDAFASGYSSLQSGTTYYIPAIAPTYFPQLPVDPLPGPSTIPGCLALTWTRNIIYVTNGDHYKLIYNCASETNDYDPDSIYADPSRPDHAWAISDDMNFASVAGW